jgi:glutathione peroxidase
LSNLNYAGFRALLGNYSALGFQLIAFPSNDFGGQAPCSSPCERAYMYHKMGAADGDFPIFDSASTVGPDTINTFGVLKHDVPAPGSHDNPPGHEISWNYEKFLVGPDGVPIRRYASEADPTEIEPEIRRLLALD